MCEREIRKLLTPGAKLTNAELQDIVTLGFGRHPNAWGSGLGIPQTYREYAWDTLMGQPQTHRDLRWLVFEAPADLCTRSKRSYFRRELNELDAVVRGRQNLSFKSDKRWRRACHTGAMNEEYTRRII